MNVAEKIKPSTDLAIVETLNAAIVFAPGGVDAILEKIRAEVQSFKGDISTAGGRDQIRSMAFKVARSKTALDEMGKELVSDWKQKAGKVDAARPRIREQLDALKDEVRKPLDDWEAAEKDRVEAHEKAILDLEALLDFGGQEPTAAQLHKRVEILAARPARQWQEFVQRASEVSLRVGKRLEDLHTAAITREAERAELDRLRREQVEREQRERDERIAREAAERARIAAETKAAREADEAAARAAATEARLEREAKELREAAERLAAKAERDKEAAIEAERKRVTDAKAREDAETAKREADKKHKAKINNEILVELSALGLSKELGVAVVAAIARGQIPHIKISY